ncbi:NADH-quinone oxidoreductase subunit NuoH [Desulfallas thermosapovorans]|uniref:NADH-quinone oxidoreductase subunit H n=1 Tax=Desulfallas thermosapovorans DSM 6562 TaxID=1121431 RepID=A0A5S4ZQL0_9FIRM|nr:NADH-quinone oxidoreductase subunit NuoH [Desulfallas thermosapovorans]TYO95175.1 NADH dehydrogenase subunit H [Desulfallas thermosapovorans DSM 6562]
MLENLFVGIAGGLRSFLGGLGVPLEINEAIVMLVKLLAILVFILVNALWLVYMERKVAAYMQARIGPNRVGPKGLLQTTCDIGKLISKEIIINKEADLIPFLLAPVLIFVPTLMVFAVIPFGQNMAAIDMNIGLLYLLAIASLSTIIFWMASWASNNKYSLLGGMRVVAQMVSYELPMVLAILGVVMIVGSLKMSDIIAAQEHTWFIFTQPIAFLIYFIAAVAECNRTPFDLMEGESELVNGFNTEYGGMAFAMFYLAEYANMLVVCALTTILFLGGWHAPFGLTIIPSWVWFFLKVYVVMFIIMQLRWTYPRIRVDQLMGFGWKVLVPLSLANIFVTGIGMYIYRAIGW